jgi:hypothetical protein
MRVGRQAVALFALAAVVLAGDVSTVVARAGDRPHVARPLAAAPMKTATPVPASVPVTPTAPPTTAASTTTTVAPPPPPPPGPAPSPLPGAWTIQPWQGVGAWVDIYDWTEAKTGGHPHIEVPDIVHMAQLGVQTLYIQTSYTSSATVVTEQDRLRALVDAAHANHMAVVGWYLPTLTDMDADFRRIMMSIEWLPLDGYGIDIESRAVTDTPFRNQLLVTLSQALRSALGGRVIAAITPSPVQIQVVNPRFWPDFPWASLGRLYDVIAPMSYWSDRRGEWRNGAALTAADVDRIRAATRPDMPIHFIGGIANSITLDDVVGMIRSLTPRHILGASLYDWSTSQTPQWTILSVLRRLAGH